MTDEPKVQRVLRVQEKASGLFRDYDLDLYDVFFYALNDDGTAYTWPPYQPIVMVLPV
jgi:hypothetical protein